MQMVNKGRGHIPIAVAARYHARDHIDPFNKLASKKPVITVNMLRHDNLHLAGHGIRYTLRCEFGHKNILHSIGLITDLFYPK